MASKFNFSSVAAYSAQCSERLLDDFFSTNQIISGKQMLELCEVKQVNLLTVRELFFRWSEEVKNLKSPYFNYEAQEVQEAIQDFMNVLSRHIAVKKEDFAPILQRSIQDTLLLIFAPYEFFSMEVTRANKPEISYEEVKSWEKYIKVNRYMLEALIHHMEEKNIQEISVDKALQLFDLVNLEQPEAYRSYLDKFSGIVPLSLQQVLENPEALENQSSSHSEERPSMDTPASTPAKEEKTDKSQDSDNLFEQPVREPQQSRVYDRFDADQKSKTLHEELAVKQGKETLAQKHASQKVENLSRSISINQRFMFVKELFQGDYQAFEQALSWLENCGSYSEALNFLTESYANKYNWTMDKEEVIEFLELIAKKFD